MRQAYQSAAGAAIVIKDILRGRGFDVWQIANADAYKINELEKLPTDLSEEDISDIPLTLKRMFGTPKMSDCPDILLHAQRKKWFGMKYDFIKDRERNDIRCEIESKLGLKQSPHGWSLMNLDPMHTYYKLSRGEEFLGTINCFF